MSHAAPEPHSDESLVLAFRRGEGAAFEQLYHRHAGAVAVTARARGAPHEVVPDVVQETFARAMQHVSDLRQPARFRSWVLAIARNITADQLRARVEPAALDPGASTGGRVDAGDEPGERLAATEPTPDELLELKELAQLVSGCLAGLSVRDATALTMVSQLGFGTADVSAALGIADGAAKVLLHRARRRLRDAVVGELARRAPGDEWTCAGLQELVKLEAGGDLVRHVRSCDACHALACEHLGYPR